ncbi:hypothetical protein ACWGJ2_19850 [Streptomyces sp. NPDC054796]
MPEEAQDPFNNPPPLDVGVHALTTRDAQLLLVSRPSTVAASQRGLPNGTATANELPRRALSRHLDERLTLRARTGHILALDHVPEQQGQHPDAAVEATNTDVTVLGDRACPCGPTSSKPSRTSAEDGRFIGDCG